jgi:hypothetical protein
MAKMIQALLVGLFITFVLDFFLFLGVYLHYIRPLGIEVYFNVLFADNQNIPLFFAASTVFGYITTYTPNKIKLPLIGVAFLASLAILIPEIGKKTAQIMFMEKNVTLHNKKFTFYGDIYYIGRDKITFFDKELKKTILLDKDEIMEKKNGF